MNFARFYGRWDNILASGTRMGRSVSLPQASGVDTSVDLSGGDRGVAEQLLDRAQVGTAFQQMGGKTVAQRVRRDAGGECRLAHPEGQAAGDVGAGEAATILGKKKRLLTWLGGEGMTAPLQIALQRSLCRLTDRQQPFFRTLTEHPQLLGLEVEGVLVEAGDLLAAQATGVGQLQHRAVAQLERRARGNPLQQCTHLLAVQQPRQLLLTLGAGDEISRVLPDPLGADEKVEEAADRGELAGHRRRRRAARGESGAVAPHVAMANLARRQPTRLRPLDELTEIDAIGTTSALGKIPCAQIPIMRNKSFVPVHGVRFGTSPYTSCARARKPSRSWDAGSEVRGAHFRA